MGRPTYTRTDSRQRSRPVSNPLFLTAVVRNGSGYGRYNTRDSHFDKVGSIRRNWYIPNGTRVQLLCQQERVTFQRAVNIPRALTKLAKSSKFTAVWNNQYYYRGPDIVAIAGGKWLRKGDTITLARFGRKGGVGKFLERHCDFRERWWYVAKVKNHRIVRNGETRNNIVVDNDGAQKTRFYVKEEHLEHVGLNNPELTQCLYDNWSDFEMLGNINKCNVQDIQWGDALSKLEDNAKTYRGFRREYTNKKRLLRENDVPGYGELYGHCMTDQKEDFTKRFWGKLKLYNCNYCTKYTEASNAL